MVIVILGPTAVGKTKLSIELAKKLNGEIINADSTQVYRNLDIATAKVTKAEQESVKHHLIDIKDITEEYSVYHYQKDARNKIDDILARKKTPIIVGGTGLYIKACLYDYEFEPATQNENYEHLTNQQLYDLLLQKDPQTKIHPNNRKRLQRALNYSLTTNKPLSQKKEATKLMYDAIFIGLTTQRSLLYEKINERVDKMIDSGLLEEAKTIYNSNVRTKAIMTPIGYKELFPYFEHKDSLENCINKIKQNSRHYAKRQYTFFNNQLSVKWFDVNFDNFAETIESVLEYIKRC